VGKEMDFDVADLIDRQEVRPIHCVVVLFTFLLMLLDGYDIVCIGYVAPLLQKDWIFPSSAFGYLFGSAALGAAVGPLLFGYLGGRFGRKPVALFGALWFGIFSLAAVGATSFAQMLALRFLTGIGMGGMMPVAIALVSEFSPRRLRATMVVIGVVGTALGGGLAGLVAYILLDAYTWRSVFLFGGVAPLLMVIVGFFILPESPKFLVLRPQRRRELVELLERLGAPTLAPNVRLILADEKNGAAASLSELFCGRLRLIVPLLTLSHFLASFALFFVNQWTTVLLTSKGVSVQSAMWATTSFQIAGFLGALSIMLPIDRWGFAPVPCLFACAAVVVCLMGAPGVSPETMTALAGLAGFCVIGMQFGNISATGQVFPTYVRSNGVGFCYGFGRLGSAVGPSIAGVFVGLGFSIGQLFYFAGGLMVLGIFTGSLLTPLYRRQVADLRQVDGANPRGSRFSSVGGLRPHGFVSQASSGDTA
jgi:MFS transporter, AAHS family, 4-hydroxybenzoate transporter